MFFFHYRYFLLLFFVSFYFIFNCSPFSFPQLFALLYRCWFIQFFLCIYSHVSFFFQWTVHECSKDTTWCFSYIFFPFPLNLMYTFYYLSYTIRFCLIISFTTHSYDAQTRMMGYLWVRQETDWQ
jgi:hypothetical protein